MFFSSERKSGYEGVQAHVVRLRVFDHPSFSLALQGDAAAFRAL